MLDKILSRGLVILSMLLRQVHAWHRPVNQGTRKADHELPSTFADVLGLIHGVLMVLRQTLSKQK